MQFKTWLETTISDFLSKTDSKPIKNRIRPFLSQHLTGRDLDVAVNLFAYIYLSEESDGSEIQKDWDYFRDFLKSNLSVKRNLFLSPITRQQLDELNIKYHRDLSVDKNLRKGPAGLPVVNVEEKLKEIYEKINLPKNFNPNLWAGWNWTSLGCGYSKEEGAAGGHCGNVGGSPGDNIFSLRSPSGNVLLTFIVNTRTGTLKEAKGVNNKKPTKDFHPAIVALIASDYIKDYKKSSYEIEAEGVADFEPEDLKYLPELYNFIQNNFKKDSFKNPENYVALNWVEQWTDEKINRLNDNEKVALLHDVLKIFNNHKPLARNYEFDDSFGPREKLNLNFKFSNLLKSAFPKVNKIKQSIEMLEIIADINENNRIEADEDLNEFRPDLVKDSTLTPKGREFFGKMNLTNVSINDIRNKNLKKKEEIDIDDDLLKILVDHSNRLSKNSRDRSEFVEVLIQLGAREKKTDDKIRVANGYVMGEPYNIFEKEIKENVDELVKEILETKKIPENSYYTIARIISSEHRSTKSNLVTIIDFSDLKEKSTKLMITFRYPEYSKEEFENYYRLNKNKFISLGYSPRLDGEDVEWWNRGYDESKGRPLLFRCVNDLLTTQFIQELRKRSDNFGGHLNSDKKWYMNNFTIEVNEDTKNMLENYLKRGDIYTKKIKSILDKVNANIKNIHIKNIKDLGKIIESNKQKLANCIQERQKETKQKAHKTKTHHSKAKFKEWLNNRIKIQ